MLGTRSLEVLALEEESGGKKRGSFIRGNGSMDGNFIRRVFSHDVKYVPRVFKYS